ncbi:uncharacterized protein LOC132717674 isoform X2 [Ruditapes philippinarum]|uniref:uncharacterized protein LOC132717674 isoform X2 n=1 Tax=Ruditapes philippinarum TaxID=129788 RepID=UPI00295A8B20|nr:uncharacterized protein LOC132717674 isoform X2 [Ruditapes philippinarum]
MATCSVDVYIKLPSGKAISSQHLPSDTVRQVAAHVAKGEGVAEGRLRLKYQGKILDKSKTIGYLGIREETILKAEIVFPKDIGIMVNFPDGRCDPLTLKNTDTVLTLKHRIDEATGISPSTQILKTSTGQKISGDSNLLCDVGVTDDTVITVQEYTPVKSSQSDGNNSDITEEVDEEKKQDLINTFNTGGRNVEVVFCFDTTGSMYSCLTTVRNKLRETCRRLLRDVPRMRIGIMAVGDYCDYDVYVTRYVDLTTDVDNLVDFADNVPSTSGCDAPEAYEWALRKAQQLDWSEDSAKAFVMIGDEIPHPPSYTDQNLFWRDELDVLAGMGVKVYGVQALNQNVSTPFYEELAERSNGFYLKLKDFNLITDMFLAVCYREADEGQENGDQGQLDAFAEEVEKEGRMTENTKQFLEKLKEEKPKESQSKASENKKRYVAQEWWDPNVKKDFSTPQYKYVQETDSWLPYHYSETSTNSAINIVPYTPTTTTTKQTSKLRQLFRRLLRKK